jgi:CRISPR-associated protein (TIGR03984 family)
MNDFIKNDVNAFQKSQSLREWLKQQMSPTRSNFLAFADDGVMWGTLVNDELVTAHDLDKDVSPELQEKTLQQAFVFGKDDEVRLFHDELGEWKTLRVVDAGEMIVESRILWGDESIGEVEKGFLRVKDSLKGIPDQLVPSKTKLGDGQCVRLEVHHLVEYDDLTGEARIAISRLAGLSIGEKNQEVAG